MIELKTDNFDTHEYLNTLMSARSPDFERYYKEYTERFSLKD